MIPIYHIGNSGDEKVVNVALAEETAFLNKAAIQVTLTGLPA